MALLIKLLILYCTTKENYFSLLRVTVLQNLKCEYI
jgi:hypothetical protein